ncbi:unnamed protein product [Linum trigynum]|uniref:Reverse transcriptase RNase H-like domain-containing protein n=1 Tax=Linum trigynum TaxID=586398 RepID=A0AAV2FE00_9ROSI
MIARSLKNLLKKGVFERTLEANTTVQRLKQAMTSTRTLAMLDFSRLLVIEADASGRGIGAVLSQAIITAVHIWRPYLLGQKFHIYTDHQSLRNLLEQQVSTPDQHKWVYKLLGYNYKIHYRPGPTNVVADGPSRK